MVIVYTNLWKNGIMNVAQCVEMCRVRGHPYALVKRHQCGCFNNGLMNYSIECGTNKHFCYGTFQLCPGSGVPIVTAYGVGKE